MIADDLHLEDNCVICLDSKKEPLAVLFCGHTFCRKCLRGVYLSKRPRQSQLPCSICRKPSCLFLEISNIATKCFVINKISTLALKPHPPSKDKTFLHPEIELNDELYQWLERQVNEAYDEQENDDTHLEPSRPVRRHGFVPPLDDSGPQPAPDSRQVTTIERATTDTRRPQAPIEHIPIAGPSRIDNPVTTRSMQKIISHSGRGRHISYQVLWTDESVTTEVKAAVANTEAYRKYSRRIRNEYQRAYSLRRNQ